MITKYLGIESVVIQYYDKITIAASVMFEGVNYDEPVYTNIFCDYYELKWLLGLDSSVLGNKIATAVVEKFVKNNGENIQIDLPDYLEPKRLDWQLPVRVNLIEDINDDIPFQCYRFQNYNLN
ncbi:MAG TPA: hypothetical protein DGG95_10435 [Cytophagales bacterium]|jgi:hypothetical protein|nr:hypothetical protein [Cytophagales bacterium]